MTGDSGNPKYTGIVKWFNNKSGFGFITVVNDCELSGKDIFAHHSSIIVKENIYKYLVQGEYVEFAIQQVETKKKDEHENHATNITGILKNYLMCETRNQNKDFSKPRINMNDRKDKTKK
jgi:cold shock CspA family protein